MKTINTKMKRGVADAGVIIALFALFSFATLEVVTGEPSKEVASNLEAKEMIVSGASKEDIILASMMRDANLIICKEELKLKKVSSVGCSEFLKRNN